MFAEVAIHGGSLMYWGGCPHRIGCCERKISNFIQVLTRQSKNLLLQDSARPHRASIVDNDLNLNDLRLELGSCVASC